MATQGPWQDYTLGVSASIFSPPPGKFTAYTRGPKGGRHFIGHFTPEEFRDFALDAVVKAQQQIKNPAVKSNAA